MTACLIFFVTFHLTIDEIKRNIESDMTNVKSLFQGAGSYGHTIESKAFSISMAAQAESSKSNTYTSTGSYSVNNSSVFDDLI